MNLEENNYLKYLVENENLTHREKAEKMSNKFGKRYNPDSIARQVQRKVKSGKWFKISKSSSVEVKESGEQISKIKLRMTEKESKDPSYVLAAHGYDEDEWQVVNLISNTWEQNNSEDGLTQLYQSKLTVKPKEKNNKEDIIKSLHKSIDPLEYIPKYESDLKISKNLNNLVINFADVHMGIATYESLMKAQQEMMDIVNNEYNQISINLIGDLIHNDSMISPVTTRGTIVDQVDMVQAVEDLKKYIEPIILYAYEKSKKVVIYFIPGNHDLTVSYMFMQYLEARFANYDIDFDCRLEHRKAYMVENVLISVAHGDLARRNLPMLLATEFPELWGKSSLRNIFVGHLHSEKKEVTVEVEDKNGATVYQLGTLKKNDYYEKKNGYTSSIKKLQLFEYDSDRLKVIYEI